MNKLFMVFDVESVGIQGIGYSVGWVIIDRSGKELPNSCGIVRSDYTKLPGTAESHAWLKANTENPAKYPCVASPKIVRDQFWKAWMYWKERGATLVADCPWPVEARFLLECIADAPEEREWQGPYPLLDVASVRLAAGLDPLGTGDRLVNELPIHDPLADARQSARLFVEALEKIEGPAVVPAQVDPKWAEEVSSKIQEWKSDPNFTPGMATEYRMNDKAKHASISTEEEYAFNMDIGGAINFMRKERKVRRVGWADKEAFVVLMTALKLPPFSSQEPGAKVNDRTAKYIGADTPLDSQPYFVLGHASGVWQPGWTASTQDLLATDWQVVP